MKCASAEWKLINTLSIKNLSISIPHFYAVTLNPDINNTVTTTSVIAEMSPITKLSGL